MSKLENKYQEALNFIFGYALDGSLNDSESNMVREKVNILQELVDEKKPMKVTDIHVDEFYCPKCHAEITHDISNYGARPKYCEECGQRLDWGEYE